MSVYLPCKFQSEKAFKDEVFRILDEADVYCDRETLISGGKPDAETRYDPSWNLYADFVVPGKQRTVIECKLKLSASTFARGLGQCLLYKRMCRAQHAILCMPDSYGSSIEMFYRIVCYENGVHFATEVNLLEVMTKLAGSLDMFTRRSVHDIEWTALVESVRASGMKSRGTL